MIFKESDLAHEYCKGLGVEFGAAAHNPFGLENCRNVAPAVDEKFYGDSQIEMCEDKAKIDIYGTADNVPLDDNCIDYIVSSHVVEHIPDLIGAFLEWNRLLKSDGIILTIFPKRDALPADIGRPLSTTGDFTVARDDKNKGVVDTDRHIWVFSIESFVELIEYCNNNYSLGWEIIEERETDDKVGNGHCVICRRK